MTAVVAAVVRSSIGAALGRAIRVAFVEAIHARFVVESGVKGAG